MGGRKGGWGMRNGWVPAEWDGNGDEMVMFLESLILNSVAQVYAFIPVVNELSRGHCLFLPRQYIASFSKTIKASMRASSSFPYACPVTRSHILHTET
jgi:hypothetical protein